MNTTSKGKYNGKRAVIVGGNSGVGFETAKMLVDEGAHVLITGRDQDKLDSSLEKLGETAIAVQSDVSSLTDIDTLSDFVKAKFGTIDALFVSAGVAFFGPFESVTEEVFDKQLTINAKGPYFTVQKLIPLLSEGSSVVLTTSVANVKGNPMTSGYAASKAALRSMTRTMVRDLLPRKIRVNAVSPGAIDTGMLERTMPAEEAEQINTQMRQENPMLRFAVPQEIAKAVLFLMFDATYTTGAEIPIDGGVSQL